MSVKRSPRQPLKGCLESNRPVHRRRLLARGCRRYQAKLEAQVSRLNQDRLQWARVWAYACGRGVALQDVQ